jgi:hypothetical protein
VAIALAHLREPRLRLVRENDPRRISSHADDARGRTSRAVHEDVSIVSLVRCTVAVPDAAARAAVCEALGGTGGPAGVRDVREAEAAVTFTLDEERTSLVLVAALVTVELAPFGLPRRIATHDPLAPETLAAVAAWGLGDPDLDDRRTIERARADAAC